MWRSILAVVAGAVIAIVLISLIDWINHSIYPPPEAVIQAGKSGDMKAAAEAIKEWLPKAPLGALLLIPASWIVATFTGSLVAALIAKRAHLIHALLAGLLPLAGTILMLRMIPHPAWITTAGLVGVPMASLLAGLLMQRARSEGPRPYDMREKNMAC